VSIVLYLKLNVNTCKGEFVNSSALWVHSKIPLEWIG